MEENIDSIKNSTNKEDEPLKNVSLKENDEKNDAYINKQKTISNVSNENEIKDEKKVADCSNDEKIKPKKKFQSRKNLLMNL